MTTVDGDLWLSQLFIQGTGKMVKVVKCKSFGIYSMKSTLSLGVMNCDGVPSSFSSLGAQRRIPVTPDFHVATEIFGHSQMRKEVRESGKKPSLGKDSASRESIRKDSRERLAPKAPFSDLMSLEQLERYISFIFGGKPPSGNASTFGQSFIFSESRDGSMICIASGNDSN
ncbi:hypothetical protein CR513_17488, partial [Mucuna pruriens]